ACVPAAPAGWSGPVFLYDGDPSQIPSCPSSEPTTAFTGNGSLNAQPAECSACTCSTPTVNCTPKNLDFSSNAGCSNTGGTAAQLPGDACGIILTPAGTKAYTAAAPTAAVAGACTPSGGSPTLPPPDWTRAGLACSGGSNATGCNAGQVCAPVPPTPFVSGACVWASGDMGCPTGFTNKHTFESSVTDTRSCSPCACGAGMGSCTGTTTVFTDALCMSTTTLTVPNDGSCTNAGGITGGSAQVSTMGSGSCPTSGGQPVGTITEGPTTTTVCCVP